MNMSINEFLSLREWAPLNDLLNKIPSRWYSGLFVSDLSLTCVDVLSDFIALGTNAGIAFWYDRKKGDLQRLRCEGQSQNITTIKVISSVDYMVACGTENGLISVFTIPKQIPNVPGVGLKVKPAERYCIRDLHTSAITSLEWSKNGMKLFSGDKTGCVVLTEIDFYMHLCKSSELLNESYEIVQLSYNHPKLLVSTVFRTIVTERKESKWEVWQVGRQDRKCLSPLGSVFSPVDYPREPTRIYSCRPGHRIWIADSEGNVEKTVFFKDTLQKPRISVPILNPSNTRIRISIAEMANFGTIFPYGPYLMTYSSDFMYILDQSKPQVIAIMTQFRNILSASVCGHEIFILEGPRSLIRISTAPDNNIIKTDNNLATIITNPIISTINSLKHFNNYDEPVETETDNELVINAEECFELPPVQKLPEDLTRLKIHDSACNSKVEVFSKISEQQFDDNILYKTQIKKKSPKNRTEDTCLNGIEKSGDVCVSEVEGEVKTTSPCVMTLSFCNKDDIIVPDLRSPQSIKQDIEKKEKKLAEVFKLEAIKINHIEEQSSHAEIIADPKLLPDFPKENEIENEESNKKSDIIDFDIKNCRNFYENVCAPSHVRVKSPNVVDIPFMWNLQKVEINQSSILQEKMLENDIDSDWEIL